MKKLLLILPILFLWFPSVTHAAIAYDNSTTSTGTGTSVTISNYTVGSSNPLLVVAVANWIQQTDVITGITFNGVAMTLDSNVSGIIQNGNPTKGYYSVYTLTGQSGTGNIVISASGAGITAASGIWVSSYTGVAQTSFIDAEATNSCTVCGNQFSWSLTVNTANSWVISGEGDGSGTNIAVASPFTKRLSPQTYINMADTNGPVSAGSVTATWSGTNMGQATSWMMAIKPATSVASLAGLILSFFGAFF
jgi:hypothetical protein